MDHAGEIASDETWIPADNPHRVTSEVYVNLGATLTILPGCEIVFETGGAGSRLSVYSGEIIARGTGWAADQRILFRPASAYDFGGLSFVAAAFDLAFCEIRGATSWAGLSVGGGSGRIERCLVHETPTPLAIGVGNAHDPIPTQLHVDHATLIGEMDGIAAYPAGGGDVRIEDSVVYSTGFGAAVDLWSDGPALSVQRAVAYSSGAPVFQGAGFYEPDTCIARDPAFVDFAAKDFRLRHDSPGYRLDRDGGPVGAFGAVRAPHPEQFLQNDLAGLLTLYGAEDSEGGNVGLPLGFPTGMFILPGGNNAVGARVFRKVFLANERAEAVYDVQISPNDSWPGLLTVEVSLGVPSDRFGQAKAYGYTAGLAIGEIAPGEVVPVWFRMTILAGAVARKTFYLPITIRASLL